MFISNQEKNLLQKNVKDLQNVLADVLVDITVLKAKIKVLEAKKKTTEVIEKVIVKPKKDIADEDRRAKQRMYARRYYAKKKLAQSKTEKKDPNVGS